MISRGITFKYLLTAVNINTPKTIIGYDVLMQRARWFGYRKDIFEQMTIILNKKMYEEYENADKYCDFLIENANNITELKKFVNSKNNEIVKLTGLV